MKVAIDKLASALTPLPTAWLIAGDEPLQHNEALDAIRQAARQQGFNERLPFNVAEKVDWNQIRQETQSFGLFGDKKIIELHFATKRPDKTISAFLCELLEKPTGDLLLIATCSKLDRQKDSKSQWVSAFDKAGAITEVWPLEGQKLQHWIEQRLASRNLQATPEAVTLLAELNEGNLLACAQEIDKLALLFPATLLEEPHIYQCVSNSSRHSLFDLTDALSNSPQRALRILESLRSEGIHELEILRMLTREARLLEGCLAGQTPRLPPQKAFALERQANRLGARSLGQALALAARIDLMIKGMRSGEAQDANTALLLRLSGQPLPPPLELF